MIEDFPSHNSDLTPAEQEVLRLKEVMEEKLGAIGVEGYSRLPRKAKKAAKKFLEGEIIKKPKNIPQMAAGTKPPKRNSRRARKQRSKSESQIRSAQARREF